MAKMIKKKGQVHHGRNQEVEVVESSINEKHEGDIEMNRLLSYQSSEQGIENCQNPRGQKALNSNCCDDYDISVYKSENNTDSFDRLSTSLNSFNDTELSRMCTEKRNEDYDPTEYEEIEKISELSEPTQATIDNRKPIIKMYNGCKPFIKKGKVHPKSNYFRYTIIRGFKKYLRTGKISFQYLKRGINNCLNQIRHLNRLKEYTAKYYCFLQELAPTEAGPLTDGKSKRQSKEEKEIESQETEEEKGKKSQEKEKKSQEKGKKSQEKTMNKSFVRKFFLNPEVLKCYKEYILVIFADKTLDELSDQFGFRCCNSKRHSMDCYKNWKYLEFYSYTGLVCSLIESS